MSFLRKDHPRRGDVFWPVVVLLVIAIVGWGSYLRIFSEEATVMRLVEARKEIAGVDRVLDDIEAAYAGRNSTGEAPDLITLQAQERRLERARTSLRNVRTRDEQMKKIKKDLDAARESGAEMMKSLIEAADGTGNSSVKGVVTGPTFKASRQQFNKALANAASSASSVEDPRLQQVF